ncbi:helix-turn-helix transcriptional regulator [Streptomyces sp. DSM 44917]|uniref:Helix-turn-helix transcriptional regulator n=1 Tax=Streptomyces boetiae TaxID=3075541 RepID=A0ABU2L9Y3_9ACTN|nr:helix-turn-helix transcriptional regulator [Streptomyces sp. DSM 44917]MDT0308373.1 helix-turn-helix transcriptional regulator [Streptomyces sp. DSM 44917]
MDTQGIGRRIAYWRGRRRLTQADFGTLMGRSRRWVQDIEGGHRQADPRLSVLEQAAQVLKVRLETLLSDEAMRSDRPCVDAAELAEIRATLYRHDILTGSCASAGPPELATLRRNIAYGWTAFQASNYSPLGRVLPPLLVGANQAAAHSTGAARDEAFVLLALTYQLAAAAATKFEDGDLAWHASDRAVVAAERSGDPVARAGAARHLSDALFHRGRGQEAVALATDTAADLEGDLRARGEEGLSVLGMLYLKATMAAAHREDHRAVPGLLHEAESVAQRLGGDRNALWTAFGPTNVRIHRVSAMVRLHEGRAAVAEAERIGRSALDALPRERRALHRVDAARGLLQSGRRPEAVSALLEAEEEAAEEVRCRAKSRKLVEELTLLGAGSAEGRLRGLAARCGLPA